MLNILYFASLREQLGCASEHVEFIPGETLQQLTARLAERHAESAGDLQAPTIRCAINQHLAENSEQLGDGAEVAYFPPVTGG